MKPEIVIKNIAERRFYGAICEMKKRKEAADCAVKFLNSIKKNKIDSSAAKFIDNQILFYTSKGDEKEESDLSPGPWMLITSAGVISIVDSKNRVIAKVNVKNKFFNQNIKLLMSACDLLSIAESVMNGKGNDQDVCQKAMEIFKKIKGV